MSTMNRMANADNIFQGERKRVLCVCSAGLLRSPTAARVLADKFDYNTRAAGLNADFALIPVDRVLLHWADEIVCMNEEQQYTITSSLEDEKLVVNLNIPDDFAYMDPVLMRLIEENYRLATAGVRDKIEE